MKRTPLTETEFLARWKEGRYCTVRGAANALYLVKGINNARRGQLLDLIKEEFGDKPEDIKAPVIVAPERSVKPALQPAQKTHSPEGVGRDASNLDFVASLSRTELETVCLFLFTLGLKMPEESDFGDVFFALEQSGIKTNHASQVMHRLKNAR